MSLLNRHKILIFNGLVLFFDLFLFYFTLVLAFYIRKNLNFSFLPQFNFSLIQFLKIFWIPLIYVFFLVYEKSYSLASSFLEEFKNLLKALLFTFLAIFLIIGIAKKSDEFSRIMLFIQFCLLSIFLPLSRYFIKRFFLKRFFLKKCIYIGLNNESFRKLKKLLNPAYGFYEEIKAYFVENKENTVRILDFLNEEILTNGVNVLILDRRVFNTYDLSLFLIKLRKYVEEIFLFDPDFKHSLVNFEFIWFPHTEFLLLKFKGGLRMVFNQYIKRFLDICLLIIIFPFFVIVFIILALLIKIDSPGPVLFKQKRIGKNGKEFFIYKFRTMCEDAERRLKRYLEENSSMKFEWENYRKLKNDPRITRVGKFLRRFSLDELPQILNVLKGEMSFVGPRPVTKEELELYYREYAEIYKEVLPGITGYWQVSGRNEIAYSTRVTMDVFYILNWSVWLDLYILFKTIPAIFSGRGAY